MVWSTFKIYTEERGICECEIITKKGENEDPFGITRRKQTKMF